TQRGAAPDDHVPEHIAPIVVTREDEISNRRVKLRAPIDDASRDVDSRPQSVIPKVQRVLDRAPNDARGCERSRILVHPEGDLVSANGLTLVLADVLIIVRRDDPECVADLEVVVLLRDG